MLPAVTPAVKGTAPEIPRAGRCRFCGSGSLFEVRCEHGPHHARLGCRHCGRRVAFVPKPWTIERARAITLWFGRHRGRTLAELAERPQGWGYLQWLAANVESGAGQAARVLLREGGAGR